jgi:hypothetical protein
MGKWSRTSTFELVRDPWLPVVYTGITMMLLGAVYLFAFAKIGKKNIDIIFYMSQNKVVQETARKDLSELVEMEILLVSKLSKKNVYNLNERF